MAKIKKDHFLLLIFFILLVVVVSIVLKNSNIFSSEEDEKLSKEELKPDYLNKPIPEIDKIKTIVNNPKFKEMKYSQDFFEPVEKKTSGKINPFIPFSSK